MGTWGCCRHSRYRCCWCCCRSRCSCCCCSRCCCWRSCCCSRCCCWICRYRSWTGWLCWMVICDFLILTFFTFTLSYIQTDLVYTICFEIENIHAGTRKKKKKNSWGEKKKKKKKKKK